MRWKKQKLLERYEARMDSPNTYICVQRLSLGWAWMCTVQGKKYTRSVRIPDSINKEWKDVRPKVKEIVIEVLHDLHSMALHEQQEIEDEVLSITQCLGSLGVEDI